MSKTFRRFIAEVVDLSGDAHPALDAALRCGKRKDLRLHLFHNLYHKDLLEPESPSDPLLAEARELLLGERRAQMKRLIDKLATVNVRAEAHLSRAPDGWGELARLAKETRADLIIRPVRKRSRWERWTLGNEDWQLVRYSPCPVLLVKDSRPQRYRKALIAIDPLHADDKPATLDHEILEVAAGFATAPCAVEVINVVVPLAATVPAMAEPAIAATGSSQNALSAAHRKRVGELVHQHGLDEAMIHVVVGDPVTEIVELAHREPVDLLIMGAVSRSALGRLLIGSTAERVLDAVDCDLLIVKPPGIAADKNSGRAA